MLADNSFANSPGSSRTLDGISANGLKLELHFLYHSILLLELPINENSFIQLSSRSLYITKPLYRFPSFSVITRNAPISSSMLAYLHFILRAMSR